MIQWLEDHLMEPLGKIAQNKYLQSIRDAFVIFALPIIITGSIFLIIANPPDEISGMPVLGPLVDAWVNAVEPIQAQLLFPFNLTFGIMAITVAFGVGYSLAQRKDDMDSVMAGILSMLAFFMTAFPVVDIEEIAFGEILAVLGGEGLFVAIILSILVTELMDFLTKRGFTFEMPASVPPYVVRSFRVVVPFMIILPLVWALQWIVYANFELTLPQAIMAMFQPLVTASNTYWAALGMILVMMVLWGMGIHGMNVVSSVVYPFWMSQLAANADAVAAGEQATGIVTEPFFHMFTHIGGSGVTLGLAIFMLFSASIQIKQVGKTSIVPSIFNINEPLIFGLPIVLNPILFIPFVMAPVVVVTINYIMFATGVMPPVVVQPPFTVPLGFGGFLATGGSFMAVLIQVLNVIVATIIYYPFFKRYEKQLVKQEQADAAEENEQTSSA
ncbi:PTS sugar transporter subunit IIC [Salicibibacter halophilus]|uniref:Permease IIC component n=1 Tax=Salicibibacter halophilus TaxID=2502791 RepID=A0A514LHU4_9BACI|nr:PTS transporter subunit EIIC [Salicibibacter halophilus]QDI91423.1 PTS sugar transporter subunit IIC [Salicibibacter halophilus]